VSGGKETWYCRPRPALPPLRFGRAPTPTPPLPHFFRPSHLLAQRATPFARSPPFQKSESAGAPFVIQGRPKTHFPPASLVKGQPSGERFRVEWHDGGKAVATYDGTLLPTGECGSGKMEFLDRPEGVISIEGAIFRGCQLDGKGTVITPRWVRVGEYENGKYTLGAAKARTNVVGRTKTNVVVAETIRSNVVLRKDPEGRWEERSKKKMGHREALGQKRARISLRNMGLLAHVEEVICMKF